MLGVNTKGFGKAVMITLLVLFVLGAIGYVFPDIKNLPVVGKYF